MIKRILLPLLILLVGGAIAVALVAKRTTLAPRPTEATPITVRAVEVEPKPVRLRVHAQGTIAPRTESDLVPEVSGNVIWVSPDLVSGGYFETGEPLLRIDDRDYRASAERGS